MTQRAWLITGVNSGFGRNMTEQLLARGDLLWLTDLDVTETPTVEQVVNKAFTELGKIDLVVNNAGYGLRLFIRKLFSK